ncbi:MAG TPA: Hsp20/alpha crystallin family protein [bacterium]
MGFRRTTADPFAGEPEDEDFPGRPVAAGRPEHPAIEETEFPAIDVFETAGELIVEAELPGLDASQIGVSAGEGLIVIEGFKAEEPGPSRVNFLCMERTFGPFRRAVLAGRAVDVTRAAATYRDGVLQVRVPKIEERRGSRRVIPVQTAGAEGGGER